MRYHHLFTLTALLVFHPCLSQAAAHRVAVVIGENAPALEKFAAGELAGQLQKLFEAQATIQISMPADDSHLIFIGSPATNSALKAAAGDQWPKLSAQGHMVKSITVKGRDALVLGGGSPVATLWAVHELGYRLGIRHTLNGDFYPVEKPAFTVSGFDVIMEPRLMVRAWSAFASQPFGGEAWSVEDHKRLITQLSKLKFTHLILPAAMTPQAALRVDGDTPGRKAFQGAKHFVNADIGSDFLTRITAVAAEAGLETQLAAEGDVAQISPGPVNAALLPHFSLESLADSLNAIRSGKKVGFVAKIIIPGDLSASAHFLSRASFVDELSASKSLSELVTPICGKEVDERLLKGFDAAAQAAALISKNDPRLALANGRMITRHLESSEAPPAWWTEAKTLYTTAMNEMYRGNTRARDGARPFILYHAKRFEFAQHYMTSMEAARKAGNAKAKGDKEARSAAIEQAVEAMYNALNALGDVARDPSDRGSIAVLNEFAYKPLIKESEDASN